MRSQLFSTIEGNDRKFATLRLDFECILKLLFSSGLGFLLLLLLKPLEVLLPLLSARNVSKSSYQGDQVTSHLLHQVTPLPLTSSFWPSIFQDDRIRIHGMHSCFVGKWKINILENIIVLFSLPSFMAYYTVGSSFFFSSGHKVYKSNKGKYNGWEAHCHNFFAFTKTTSCMCGVRRKWLEILCRRRHRCYIILVGWST